MVDDPLLKYIVNHCHCQSMCILEYVGTSFFPWTFGETFVNEGLWFEFEPLEWNNLHILPFSSHGYPSLANFPLHPCMVMYIIYNI